VGGLVDQQHLRLTDEGARHTQALLHAVRVRPHRTVGGLHEVDRLQQFGRARDGITPAQPLHPGEEAQVLATGDPQVERAVARRYEADATAQRGRAPLGLVAQHADAALGGSEQAHQSPQQRGLTGPVGAEEGVHLAGAHAETNVVQDARAPEHLSDTTGLDRDRGRRRDGNRAVDE